MVDKGQLATIEEALGLRNRSEQRTIYRPGVKKVSGSSRTWSVSSFASAGGRRLSAVSYAVGMPLRRAA